jgi:glycosyltransferase involved in cell wall biosynthesis
MAVKTEDLPLNNPCQPAFTVFTPTYNRVHTLGRVYGSLQKQTLRDFEWLIVDDGSSDDTFELIQSWQREADFPIRYFRQDHQGKHIAFNRGVQEAYGELFLLIDSDDEFLSEALERFLHHWESIPMDQREQFVGVTALCIDQNAKLVGDPYPWDIIDSDALEIRYRYKIRGEKWGFNRTAVLKEFLFPEILKRTYLPEGIIWNKIARKYKTRFINEGLRIYWIEGSSLVHGKNKARTNAQGGQLQHLNNLNNELDWFRYAPGDFFRSAVHFGRFSFHVGDGPGKQFKMLENRLAQVLWFLMLPLAVMIFLKDPK